MLPRSMVLHTANNDAIHSIHWIRVTYFDRWKFCCEMTSNEMTSNEMRWTWYKWSSWLYVYNEYFYIRFRLRLRLDSDSIPFHSIPFHFIFISYGKHNIDPRRSNELYRPIQRKNQIFVCAFRGFTSFCHFIFHKPICGFAGDLVFMGHEIHSDCYVGRNIRNFISSSQTGYGYKRNY